MLSSIDPAAAPVNISPNSSSRPPKVLLVVAHPDDEYYFAAAVYRIARELDGVVDQVVITNGGGGHRFSSLAEKIYGVSLTGESSGRDRLAEIRRRETLAAGRILGIRNHHFLEENDQCFTLSADDALGEGWDCARVREGVRELILREDYDFVFTMLPSSTTHGHHQAATLLVLDVVEDLPPKQRPVLFAGEPGRSTHSVRFCGLPGFPLSQPVRSEAEFIFDRRRVLDYGGALRYEIVVNWVIAEHKSQGMFQNDVGKHDVERFWRFSLGPEDADRRSAAFVNRLQDFNSVI